jgi:hypothetical protein
MASTCLGLAAAAPRALPRRKPGEVASGPRRLAPGRRQEQFAEQLAKQLAEQLAEQLAKQLAKKLAKKLAKQLAKQLAKLLASAPPFVKGPPATQRRGRCQFILGSTAASHTSAPSPNP